ncbi:hypothetical protein O7632_04910 [Solwaraspora sp. WMMD406]|uniref:hypothetical protein n=1 Tax=Solwaraspora sp. WMMD406 TaxID=3016095 RepID=UPI0024169ED8|nr:hypothetical protein [Solwaraspora sp. WMMD406]MDG4763450.1 hypothetical protein [Solwaraspora sp. WMMD406]
MRTVRTALAIACASGALLAAFAAPTQAAPSTAQSAAQTTAYNTPNNYHFGTYYTLDACRYFGESLTAAGTWRYYSCRYEWDIEDQQGYYHLWMFN